MINDCFKEVRTGCLITAGTIDNYNSMTIGWGTYGSLWSKKVFIAFVKPCRYTYSFLEKNEYFTISFYDETKKPAMTYFGTHSGKDVDKAKETGFNPINVNDVSVSFKEAKQTLLCKKIYVQDLDINNIPKEYVDKYYLTEAPHRVYVGEIIEEM